MALAFDEAGVFTITYGFLDSLDYFGSIAVLFASSESENSTDSLDHVYIMSRGFLVHPNSLILELEIISEFTVSSLASFASLR